MGGVHGARLRTKRSSFSEQTRAQVDDERLQGDESLRIDRCMSSALSKGKKRKKKRWMRGRRGSRRILWRRVEDRVGNVMRETKSAESRSVGKVGWRDLGVVKEMVPTRLLTVGTK